MSHLLKRTKKSCIKLMRKLSNKQIFLKRLEEEDISNEIEVTHEAKEKDINQNEDISPENTSCYHKTKKCEGKASCSNAEDHKDNSVKRKLAIHFEEVTPDKAVLQSLTSKLFLTADGYEFRRLQQLRSDTASEIVPYDPQFSKARDIVLDDTKLEVVFEKVKYKEDVRYLRHTPSNCSLDNYIINGEAYEDDFIMIMSSNNTHNMNTRNVAKDLEYYNTTVPHAAVTTATTTTATTNRGLVQQHNHMYDENQEHNLPPPPDRQQQPQQSHDNHLPLQQLNQSLPLNVSLGCITDGNYHQLFIGEERNCFYKLTPVVKWDINGNSLEDDDFPELGMNLDSSPAKSSLRSSSTTLETWLEEEELF